MELTTEKNQKNSVSEKSLTIGALCKKLRAEFPDISISKIRYLEDQKLLQPKRTTGGYRLYSEKDVLRLQTILRLQRDEFLPLRIIRQELDSGRLGASTRPPDVNKSDRPPSRIMLINEQRGMHSQDEILELTKASSQLLTELEDYGIINGQTKNGTRYYDDAEREIIRAAAQLARYGVAGRNLRVFRTSVEREAALIQQILAPALRSRNPQRRREALEALENLSSIATNLKHLLLIRELRQVAAG